MSNNICNKPVLWSVLGNSPQLLKCGKLSGHIGRCSPYHLEEETHKNICPHCGKDPIQPVPQEELDARGFTEWSKNYFEARKNSPFHLPDIVALHEVWNAAIAYARKDAVKG